MQQETRSKCYLMQKDVLSKKNIKTAAMRFFSKKLIDMTDLEKYSTTDLIKIWAKHKGWSIEDAQEAIDVARSNKKGARSYFMFLVQSIKK